MEEAIQMAIKKISGILKSNEIPNANYLLYNGYLMIEMYDTVLYFYQIKGLNILEPISFNLIIDDNKNIIPFDVNNANRTGMLLKIFADYTRIVSTNMQIAEQSNLQDDPDFSKLLALKSSDGMKFYKMHNNELYSISYLPVFSGFPAMVKNDTISAKVYKDDTEGYSIVEYTIYKNKLKDYIKLYFRILNIGA